MRPYSLMATIVASLCLAACGGGSVGNTNPPPSTYTVGGTVNGLVGSGLVLRNNGGNNLAINASGAFTFSSAITGGAHYNVTVLTQPSTQNCAVTGGSGTATSNVSNVVVTCTTITYTIGGSISGLSSSGLVLLDNKGDNLSVAANQTSFTFATPIISGAAYSVTILTQPSAQNCVVGSGNGTATSNVSSVVITCTTLTYTIGGTVTRLSGSGLVLQDNNVDNLKVASNQTSFTFATPLASGSAYAVTVLTQPSMPAENCVVRNGSGTVTANVTSIQVACSINEWTWVNGSNVINQKGSYGSVGVANPTNMPGARSFAASSIDSAGNLWLWGGEATDSTGAQGVINDVWKYSGGEGWIWIDGSNFVFQPGTYGTQGVAAPSNIPGGREQSVSWTDAAGNFWSFGGFGLGEINSASSYGYLNDLWKYSADEWTWMSGSNMINPPGSYGTQGIASPGNVPGAREGAVSWIDAAGNLWLFGGNGLDSSGVGRYLNDLWKYNSGEWTWMSGSNIGEWPGIYGTQGTAGSTNVPGGRVGAVSWIDATGDLWLFGGYGFGDSASSYGYLNDLWKYNGAEWTWIGGSNVINQPGTYGTQGLADPNNVPGGRQSPTIWIDASGNVWLFGGQGLDSTGTVGKLNDLWKYSEGEWTWISGSSMVNQPGAYGTEGLGAATNVPGARGAAVGWIDAAGNLWLFGGNGSDSTGAVGLLNDLWEYEP